MLLVVIALLGQERSAQESLLERLRAYVVDYEPRLSELMAEEVMVQRARNPTGRIEHQPVYRKLTSDIAFLRLPGEGPWLGYRSVTHVDGRAVADRSDTRLQALLAGGEAEWKRAIEIARESARFNLGSPRTTNMPTLALELVHPRHQGRFAFRIEGHDRIDGRRLARIAFDETERPTLIRSPQGYDVAARGWVWVDEPTGRLFQSEVRERAIMAPTPRLFESIVKVTFREDATLGLLVPARMYETFAFGSSTGQGDAHYANYRRFSTSARIVPQP